MTDSAWTPVTYTHVAAGLGPETFALSVVVEWANDERGGYRVSVLDGRGEVKRSAGRPYEKLGADPSPYELNALVRRHFAVDHTRHGEASDWWSDFACLAWELADHEAIRWYPACHLDRSARARIEELAA
ncbi:hypothetical protein [Streptomyces sp. CBMA123]|uniref:hypothetical protein n=1 Tax=Streptomyces sp. CBMA123 TaxID=1896313 RepID=UPI001661A272|nr:hypothetical protein [Streptomyces sp. CBMA123]MBD0689638.1 hypothetical protein [Streptomyces sp. CBMA123]